jgi:ketosteroid isomerase-like protein
MKKLLFIIPLVILLCFAIGCEKEDDDVAEEAKPVVDIEAEKAAVKTLVDEWMRCFETEDIETFSNIIAHDPDMVNFGTDAAERWIGWEALQDSVQRQFESTENVIVSTRDLIIFVHKAGEVAWFSMLMDMEGMAQGEPFSLEGMRLTGVFEKRDGNWFAVQIHGSVPVSGQAIEY